MNEVNVQNKKRPFSLKLYILIVFGLSWPFQFLGIWVLPTFSVTGLWFMQGFESIYIFNVISMIMVTVGTYLAGKYVFKDGFKYVGWRWGNPIYYLAIVGTIFLVWGLPILIDVLRGALPLPPGITGEMVLLSILLFSALNLIPAFGEEFGWRGYMLPNLARIYNDKKAVLVSNLVWWAWHIPILAGIWIYGFLFSGLSGFAIPLFFGLIVVLIGQGVVFAWFWARSRSIAVASTWHSVHNAVSQNPVINYALSQPQAVGASLISFWPSIAWIILGLALLWKGNWKYLQEIRAQDDEQ